MNNTLKTSAQISDETWMITVETITIDLNHFFSYDKVKKAASYVLDRTKSPAKIGIICDFGAAALAENMENRVVIPYSSIPYFPKPIITNRTGVMIFGTILKVPLICCQRSFRYYDGHTVQECTFCVRMLKLLNVECLILTNSGRAINADYETGDIMILKDHVNILGLAGVHPLMGPNEDHFGVRFPSMKKCYDPNFIDAAKNVLCELKFPKSIHLGVYAAVAGPNYETSAENTFFRKCGIDSVGTSMVPEAIVAKHCGIKVLALTLIVVKDSEENICCFEEITLQSVLQLCKDNIRMFKEFFVGFIKFLTRKSR